MSREKKIHFKVTLTLCGANHGQNGPRSLKHGLRVTFSRKMVTCKSCLDQIRRMDTPKQSKQYSHIITRKSKREGSGFEAEIRIEDEVIADAGLYIGCRVRIMYDVKAQGFVILRDLRENPRGNILYYQSDTFYVIHTKAAHLFLPEEAAKYSIRIRGVMAGEFAFSIT